MIPKRLFAYFRQRYEGRVEIDADGQPYSVPDERGGYADEKLHLAVSEDGRHFQPLNAGKPVWDQWLRDPFIGKAPDGFWHLVATCQTPGCILHATSHDLLHWNSTDVPIIEELIGADGRKANNAWAPEWIWDAAAQEFFVFWSSSFEREGWMKSRLYFSRTRDWRTFTTPHVLFAPPYSVIDGSLILHESEWWLFHKEEEFGPSTGERRAIRLAVSDFLEGPYQTVGDPIAPVITEGPCVADDPCKDGWLLYFDYCMADGYGMAESADLVNWVLLDDIQFPDGARHGSIVAIGTDELNAFRI